MIPHLDRLEKICTKHDIALVYLFGSQAENGVKVLTGTDIAVDDPLTDLDVGIVTNNPLPPAPERAIFFANFYNEFEDLFQPFRLEELYNDKPSVGRGSAKPNR